MYDFAFVLGLADEECCPIVLKFFHSHIYIKNKDISSPKCNIWDYYPQIFGAYERLRHTDWAWNPPWQGRLPRTVSPRAALGSALIPRRGKAGPQAW
jgi:hypothetical protein